MYLLKFFFEIICFAFLFAMIWAFEHSVIERELIFTLEIVKEIGTWCGIHSTLASKKRLLTKNNALKGGPCKIAYLFIPNILQFSPRFGRLALKRPNSGKIVKSKECLGWKNKQFYVIHLLGHYVIVNIFFDNSEQRIYNI